MQAYHTAQQALTNQVHTLQQEAQKELAELEASLPKKAVEIGIPDAEMETVVADLQEVLHPARDRIERTSSSITEARAMKTAIMSSRLDLSKKVQEIRARYQTEGQVQSQEVYMSWHNLLGQQRISSPDDLKQIIETLQRHVYTELEQQHIVIIE